MDGSPVHFFSVPTLWNPYEIKKGDRPTELLSRRNSCFERFVRTSISKNLPLSYGTIYGDL